MAALCDRVSVVVPCRNEAARIATLLDAIRSQEMPVLEVVVVDTGSTDGTVDSVRRYQRHHSDLSLKCLSHPGSNVADAMNKGIEAARGEIIVRLDGHSRPNPDYVRRALDTLRETGAAVVGGVWEIVPGGAGRSPVAGRPRSPRLSPARWHTRLVPATPRIAQGGRAVAARRSTPCRSDALPKPLGRLSGVSATITRMKTTSSTIGRA